MPDPALPARPPQTVLVRLLLLLSTAVLLLPLLPEPAAGQTSDGGTTPARVQGADRFQTAARVADLAFDDAEVAVLATGLDFPDALAGSLVAGREGAPILLVEGDGVPASTLAMLDELGVTRVLLLGGTATIGTEVEEALEDEGYPSERIAGADRYETAVEIALRYGGGPDAQLDGQPAAVLASGRMFADALSAGPLAAAHGVPLLLTPGDTTLPGVEDALAQLDVERLVIVGGEAAVSEDVAARYRQLGHTVERIAGPTRGATAARVADALVTRVGGFSPQLALLARGDAFPDALSASIHAARQGAPILLAPTPDVLGEATGNWLSDHCPDVDVVRAVGGTAAVAIGTAQAAVDAAEECLGPNEEVARFTTPLIGNPDRTHNLHLAADYIDGDIIASGDSYSLNHGIGRRTQARGFREVEDGCIGADGQAVDCVGGGVSQMGTTFLNTAWFTGIEIVDFRQHSRYFQRYPVCHEATLSWGYLDVVVHNDSPFDIVIDAFYSDEHIGVRFVSRDWADVSSWAQPQTPPSSGSFTSECGRTITYPDGTSRSEHHTWTYDDTGF